MARITIDPQTLRMAREEAEADRAAPRRSAEAEASPASPAWEARRNLRVALARSISAGYLRLIEAEAEAEADRAAPRRSAEAEAYRVLYARARAECQASAPAPRAPALYSAPGGERTYIRPAPVERRPEARPDPRPAPPKASALRAGLRLLSVPIIAYYRAALAILRVLRLAR